MLKSKELISIIVPVYNIENYIEKCVISLVNQTYKNIEILLIDDGSSDKSSKLCDKYDASYESVKAFHKKNGGLSSARNYGIKMSKGKYICFVDGDDWIDLNLIEVLYKNLKSHNADISISNRTHVFDTGKERKKFDVQNEIKEFTNLEAIKEINNYKYFDMSACGKIFDRKLFDNILFPEGKICEDFYIMYKIMEKSKKVIYTSSINYYYFQRIGSITKQAKLNWDFVNAAKEQMDYIENKYSYLKTYVRASYVMSNITIYNTAYLHNAKISKAELKQLQRNIFSNLKYLLKCKDFSKCKKIRGLLWIFCRPIYNWTYKIAKKIEKY